MSNWHPSSKLAAVALFAVLGASDQEMDAACAFLSEQRLPEHPSEVYAQAKEALKKVRRELDRT